MRIRNVLVVLSSLSAPELTQAAKNSFLRVTATVTNAQNHSALACLEFTEPLAVSTEAGTSGSATFTFPHTNETIYTVIPPRLNGGLHNAPAPQLVAFMSGLAHVTLPIAVSKDSSLDEAWILGGAYGLLLALDVEGSGHITTYPSDQPTVVLQIPFKSVEDVPAYSVVAKGPCHFEPTGDQVF